MEKEPTMNVDVNAAWERFKQKVQNEPVATVWTEGLSVQKESTVLPSKGIHSLHETQEIAVVNQVDIHQSEIPYSLGGRREKNKKSASSIRVRNRVWRNTAAAAAVVAVIGGGLATPFGQKVAAEALQTFYVQHLKPINSNDIQTLQNALGYPGDGNQNQNFHLQQYGDVKVQSTQPNVSQPMTRAQIEQVTGYSIPTLPGIGGVNSATDATSGDAASGGVSYSYSPSETVTMQLHVNAINQMIQQLGGTTPFPSSADNEPIVLTFPSQVTEYSSVGNNRQYENLLMMRTPSVVVPDNVDVNQVRQAIVSLPFMPSDIISALNAQDWNSTLYVPQGSNSHMATVNGHDVIVSSDSGRNQSMAMWIMNGCFYELSGSTSQFPTEASILDAVKEISG